MMADESMAAATNVLRRRDVNIAPASGSLAQKRTVAGSERGSDGAQSAVPNQAVTTDVNTASQSHHHHHQEFGDNLQRLRELDTSVNYREGWLKKRPVFYKHDARKWGTRGLKKRYFRLTDDTLYYFKDDKRSEFKGYVSFNASTQILPGADPNSLVIEDHHIRCTLEAASEAECTDWTCDLQHVLERWQSKDSQKSADGGDGKPTQERAEVTGTPEQPERASRKESAPDQGHFAIDANLSPINRRASVDELCDEDELNLPDVSEAMSTCKKRRPSTRVDQLARENEELRAALAAQALDRETELLKATVERLEKQIHGLKKDKPDRRSRRNVETSDQACNCSIM